MSSNTFAKANPNTDYSDYIRIVLVGKTGNGKSATCNSLIGSKAFVSKASMDSVTTKCEAITFNLNEKKILLVDTVGISDTSRPENEILNELKSIMDYTYPGIHVFVTILSTNRFTNEEKYTIELISKFFGKQANNYAMIVFTRIDDLEHDDTTLKEYIDTTKSDSLRELVYMCKTNYLGVNNRWKNDDPEMIQFRSNFIKMVLNIIESNKEFPIYTSAQFETSIKHFEAERKRIEKEKLDEAEKNRLLQELIEKQKEQMNQLSQQINELKNRPSGGGGGGGCQIL